MKNFLYIISLSFTIFSCDDKIKSLEDLNQEPIIEYFSRNTTDWTLVNGKIVDSAKVYNELNNAIYSIALRSNDTNNNFETITISDIEEGADFFINDSIFVNQRTVKIDSFSLSYRFNNPDIRIFSVNSLDDFGKFKEVDFEIHFLENLPPTPNFEIRTQNNNGFIEHIIDGSFSFDRDNDRGGFITNYEFTIDGIIINSTDSQINHVFSKGEHIISLRVQDNDGIFSNQITNTIFIQ